MRQADVAFSPIDKVSNEGLHSIHARTKIRVGGFRGILRRFAKYTLLRMDDECCPCERTGILHFSQRIPDTRYSILSETFRFIDTAHLLESETPDLLLPFSKDLTSGHETIVFGR